MTSMELLTPQNKKRLSDKNWRLNHLYKIIDKNKQLITFQEKPIQKRFNETAHSRNIILKSRQHGFCLDPKTKVLTASLEWIEISKLKIGQKIISVDELSIEGRGKSRKMRTAEVEGIFEVEREAYKIIFDDGREVICTDQHPWLSKKAGTLLKWRAIKPRLDFKGYLNVGTKIKYITIPWETSTFEDGWFGGIIDGEGSMGRNKKHSSSISISQRGGDVFERMKKYCDENGYHYSIEEDTRPAKDGGKFGTKLVYRIEMGRMDELFKLIGKTRPSRFLKDNFWEGRELPGKKTSIGWAKIVKIEKLGIQKLIDLQTSTGTYIADGFVSHNTTNACIDGLDDVLFNKNFKFTIIADTLEHATEIFEKIKTAWVNFPLKDYWTANTDTVRQLSFNNGSIVKVTTSARSATVNRLHISELGAIASNEPKKAKELITGSIPAVPKDGRVDIESTARGEVGVFFDLCQNAMKQDIPESQIDFKFHFFGWLEDDDCVLEGDFDIPQDLKEYQEKFEIKQNKINWYYQQGKLLGEDMQQEYPTYPDEAFMFSGKKLFDQNIIATLMQYVEAGKVEGKWVYYRDYKPGHLYGLGADVSEGIGQDYNTIAIWDFTAKYPEIVAIYRNNVIAPDLFAYEIKNGAEKYGMAMCGVERNNTGHATLTQLKQIYPIKNIFKEVRTDRTTDKETDRIGWNTTLTTKPKMMYDLRKAVNDDLLDIPSKYVLEEMRTYDMQDLQVIKFDEEITNHWDLLIAVAIGFQMRNYLVEERMPTQFIPKNNSSRFSR